MRISPTNNAMSMDDISLTPRAANSVAKAKNISNVEPKATSSNNDSTAEIKDHLKQAVSTMNDVLSTTDNTSRFMYHEGLERYYVTIVDKETDEIVREIPPKDLLDAFYKMQKLMGLIVDEKI